METTVKDSSKTFLSQDLVATIDVIGVCLPGVNPNVRHLLIYAGRGNFVCIYKFSLKILFGLIYLKGSPLIGG